MWYVYFLRLRNTEIYVGSTNDLRRRFAEHATAKVQSTRASLPAQLVAYVGVQDEPTARTLERYFKSGSGKAFATKRFWPLSQLRVPGPPPEMSAEAHSKAEAEKQRREGCPQDRRWLIANHASDRNGEH